LVVPGRRGCASSPGFFYAQRNLSGGHAQAKVETPKAQSRLKAATKAQSNLLEQRFGLRSRSCLFVAQRALCRFVFQLSFSPVVTLATEAAVRDPKDGLA
jgi:hypothetical protein